jgi:hypothetical protein
MGEQVALCESAMGLVVIDREHPMRDVVEKYVAERYASAFDAQIEVFMPVFLALLQGDQIRSVCGYRHAGRESLFLEQYCDRPVEEMIAEKFSQPVSRASLVEFGQLAAFSKGLSPYHFYLITKHFVALNYQWCICTVTDPLYALMKRLGLNPTFILEAHPDQVKDAHQWGSYYRYQPRIVAGNLRHSLAYLQRYRVKHI